MIRIASITDRDRQTLGRGVLVIVLLIFAGRVLPAVHRWELETIVRSLATRNRADSLLGSMAQRSDVSRRLDSLRVRARAEDSGFVTLRTIAEAAPRFAGMIRDLAGNAGVGIQSIQPRIDSTHSKDLPIVTARIALTTDIVGLTELVRLVEVNRPILRIAYMSIAAARPESGNDQPDVLRTEMIIEGLIRLTAMNRE